MNTMTITETTDVKKIVPYWKCWMQKIFPEEASYRDFDTYWTNLIQRGQDNLKIYLLEDKNKIVGLICGLCMLSFEDEVMGSILHCYIEEDYRRIKNFKLLTQELEKFFLANDCKSNIIELGKLEGQLENIIIKKGYNKEVTIYYRKGYEIL